MKKVISLFLALVLCISLCTPAYAANGALTPKIAQAYLDTVDGLAAEYGSAKLTGGAGGTHYVGMGGGYLADLGGSAVPELVIGIGASADRYGMPTSPSLLRVYAWNGSAVMLVEEYEVIASGNGRAWDNYELLWTSNGAYLKKTTEYLGSFGEPGATEIFYERFNGSAMIEARSAGSASRSVMLADYDYNCVGNYADLRAELRSSGANPTDICYRRIPYWNAAANTESTYIPWTDAHPFVDSSHRTMVPLRAAGETLGLSVEWDAARREAVFSNTTFTTYRELRFPVGSKTAMIYDYAYELYEGVGALKSTQKLQMDTSCAVVDGRVYAPIRYLAETFGRTVTWDASTGTVYIDYQAGPLE